jgi:hypothetical protein
MNDDVRKAVQHQLGNAEDNLYRATAAFRAADLTVQHGQSGQTRGQIIDGYQEEVDRWKAALASLEGKQ